MCVYFSLQYYSVCFCGNEYDRYGPAKEDHCYLKCHGDRNEICGGNWVNSVYSGIHLTLLIELNTNI